jgi:hypothetical protein
MIADAISRLKTHIEEVPVKFAALSDKDVSTPPAPGKWSKKEILGHLIDSACNNHSRFVRSMFEEEPIKIVKYKQDEWVNYQRYSKEDTQDIVNLWKAYNTHIVNIFNIFPEEKLNVKWDIDGDTQTTEWLITDYVDHLEHHLEKIFN